MSALVIFILIFTGFVFLIVEVFALPGSTIMGILGGLFMVSGVAVSYIAYNALTGTVVLLISAGFTVLFFYFSWRAGWFKPFVQGAKIDSKADYIGRYNLSPGTEGITETVLRPAGTARFGEIRADVVSDGEMIPPNTRIKIHKIADNKITVVELT